MAVTYPDGTAVDCNDTANVHCLTMDSKPGDRMVQFVQVNTNGLSGVFKATVAVGPSGGGTFSFNALAASELRASSPDRHTLPLGAQLSCSTWGGRLMMDSWKAGCRHRQAPRLAALYAVR